MSSCLEGRRSRIEAEEVASRVSLHPPKKVLSVFVRPRNGRPKNDRPGHLFRDIWPRGATKERCSWATDGVVRSVRGDGMWLVLVFPIAPLFIAGSLGSSHDDKAVLAEPFFDFMHGTHIFHRKLFASDLVGEVVGVGARKGATTGAHAGNADLHQSVS